MTGPNYSALHSSVIHWGWGGGLTGRSHTSRAGSRCASTSSIMSAPWFREAEFVRAGAVDTLTFDSKASRVKSKL